MALLLEELAVSPSLGNSMAELLDDSKTASLLDDSMTALLLEDSALLDDKASEELLDWGGTTSSVLNSKFSAYRPFLA